MPTSTDSSPRSPPSVPDRLIAVAGTGTDIGKTWITATLAERLRADGVRVAARKPAQSFADTDAPETRDASVLAAATGERPDDVCPPHRNYERALAPPMAAAALGRPPITLDELIAEIAWPDGVELGFVETAGGVRSPIADDADNVGLIDAIAPDLVVVVADPELGTLNLVRLTVGALAAHRCLVVLNRFDARNDLHLANHRWLTERDGLEVVTSVEQLLVSLDVRGAGRARR